MATSDTSDDTARSPRIREITHPTHNSPTLERAIKASRNQIAAAVKSFRDHKVHWSKYLVLMNGGYIPDESGVGLPANMPYAVHDGSTGLTFPSDSARLDKGRDITEAHDRSAGIVPQDDETRVLVSCVDGPHLFFVEV